MWMETESMKKNRPIIPITVLGLLLAGWTLEGLWSSVPGNTPDTARPGKPVLFQYNPTQPCEDVTLLLYTELLSPPSRIPMETFENRFMKSVVLPDTGTKMILYAFEYTPKDETGRSVLDNYDGRYRHILLSDESGRPLRNALFQLSLSHSGYSGIRTENLTEAMNAVEKELSLYPENHQARLHLYSLILRINQNSESARSTILRDINRILSESDTLPDLEFAAGAYRLAGETKQAERVEKRILERYPSGELAAMQAFEQIMKMEDPQKRFSALEIFIDEFPGGSWVEHALSAMTGIALEMDDDALTISASDQLMTVATSPGAASSLAGAAGVLIEKESDMQRAVDYIRKALDIIDAAKSSTPPPEISFQEWKEGILTTEGRYRDILGWVYVKQGNIEEGVRQLQRAVQGTSQPAVYYHLGVALEKAGNEEAAFEQFARAAAFEGTISDMAYVMLDSLWKRRNRTEEAMAQLLSQEAGYIKNRYRERVLSMETARPAPDFELETLDGDWIRLKDQRGLVVLTFWAAWSRSAQQLIRTLPGIAADFPEVLFLTVSTDPYFQDVEYVARRLRLNLPVLLNNRTDQAYGIRGVPTVFVIDSDETIRFVHKGFTDDFEQRLVIQLEALLKRQR